MSTNVTVSSVQSAAEKGSAIIDAAKEAGILDIDEALLLIAAICLLKQNPTPAIQYLLELDAELTTKDIIVNYTNK